MSQLLWGHGGQCCPGPEGPQGHCLGAWGAPPPPGSPPLALSPKGEWILLLPPAQAGGMGSGLGPGRRWGHHGARRSEGDAGRSPGTSARDLAGRGSSPSSALLLAPDRNPRPSKLRVREERGQKGPLQAGTARRHICDRAGPSRGPWGRKEPPSGSAGWGRARTLHATLGPGPDEGQGLEAAAPRAGAGRARGTSLRWGRRRGASSGPRLTRAAWEPSLGAPPRPPASN